jgi:hypothetical protein
MTGGAGVVLAAGGGAASAGLIGFLVVVGLIIACALLFRSMNKHIRGVRERELAAQQEESPGDEAPSSPTGTPTLPRRGGSIADKKAWQAEHAAGPDGTVRGD